MFGVRRNQVFSSVLEKTWFLTIHRRRSRMKIGIGYSNIPDSFQAGTTAAEMAMQQAQITRPNLVLAFCSGALNAPAFFQGLQAVVGTHVPIIGGSAVGIITNTALSHTGFPAGAVIFEAEDLRTQIAVSTGINQGEYQAGNTLAQQLSRTPDDKVLLLFYDSIKLPATVSSPPIMNASPPLLLGIETVMGQSVPIIGAGVAGDLALHATQQFCGSFVGEQCAVGALLSGAFDVYFRIMHGCIPMDGVYHTITRIAGATIYEVDGQPIVPMLDALYGSPDWQAQMPVKRLSIGVNMGGKYDDFQEDRYVNRLISGIQPGGNGIVLFEPDLAAGMEIQFMLRDGAQMIASAQANAAALLAQIKADGRRPVFAFYIDCAGRCAAFSETLTEEAAEIQTVCQQHHIPLLGFYSGVEIAPFLGQSRGLDWTGVLMALTE
jgi:hypothetical protein